MTEIVKSIKVEMFYKVYRFIRVCFFVYTFHFAFVVI